MEQLLETSELKTRLCHRFAIKVPWKQPEYAALLNKVFIFNVILISLTKYFGKHEIFLQYITASMKI